MKVLPIHGNENWICDRYAQEWTKHNSSHACQYGADRSSFLKNRQGVHEADVLWLLAPWEWKSIPEWYLKSNKVVCTIHHMVPDKVTDLTWSEFRERDQYVDAYHTSCQASYDQFSSHIGNKPCLVSPFWSNRSAFFPIRNKDGLRSRYGIWKESYVVGSFQRDTEGSDLKSPKLEKGPDILCDILEKIKEAKPNLEVLLAGWRRQYVKGRLDAAGIKYKYIERPPIQTINKLYNCLDQYIVASRYEGGPQSISECIMTKTPIVSTRVGLASKFLHPKSLFSDSEDFFEAYSNLETQEHAEEALAPHLMPYGFNSFNSFFDSL